MTGMDINLSLCLLKERLSKINPHAANPSPDHTRAAILIPVVVDRGAWQLLYTRRTEHVNNHKGQVSFPGGVIEQFDEYPVGTALREAQEEIGLQPTDVQILGVMDGFHSRSNFFITPVVGYVNWPYPIQISQDEVSRYFTIPVSWLLDTTNWEERLITFPGGREEKIVYFNSYEGEILWGITARITLNFINIFIK